MLIPYQYNRMAAGAMVIDSNRAIYGTRGVFTFLRNGSCNQSAMTMSNRYLVSSAVSRMEVSSAGLALNDGEMFGPGGEGHMRLNVGLPRIRLAEALERLRAAVDAR